mmetsp:Transcript_10223/g.14494  ORF Transcript_10223/g.14494 Transcript_10223/m.14494 type:complete len:293 (-) Transcript_10223:32-910(-)
MINEKSYLLALTTINSIFLLSAVGLFLADRKNRDKETAVRPTHTHFDSNISADAPKRLLNHGIVTAEEGNMVVAPLLKHLSNRIDRKNKPIVLAIAGGTGSGKTTLTNAVYEAVGKENVTYLCHDQYYRDQSHVPLSERSKTNFDHPDALETDLLTEHLKRLKNNEPVKVPLYSFETHTRIAGSWQEVVPKRVILLEGILIYSDEALRNEIDIKIFVDTDADIRFIRRLKRDIAERGRTLEGVVKQYLETVQPMHEQYVEPSRRYSDMIVPIGLNAVALDLVVSRLKLVIET